MFLLTMMLVSPLPAKALDVEELSNEDFFDLDLEQLADIDIRSVAKKTQKLSEAAAAVFVLSQEDIRRSGVTTIADALRLVPGVQVAKLDANKWAISIRGFNDIFSNKLLVLMDGRTVYSPFFGGVYWDTIDTVLADIERIEVIRGPGGSLWGSNAVNGVINILTKQAKDSSGLLVSAHAGNKERGGLTLRYGGQTNDQTDYRVYFKGFEKDNAEGGVDDWRMGRMGFRIDSAPGAADSITVQGDVYAGEEGERAISDKMTPPFGTFASTTDVFGANILMRWQRELGNDSDFIVQAYYDHAEREHFYVKDSRDTFDIDIQHRFQAFWRQEIIWGFGFRYITDDTRPGTVMQLTPAERSDQIYSAFIQDEISVIEDQLVLTLGSKFEHNSYTGFEYQPSVRILWKPHQEHSLWGAVSRAVRIPSRMEHGVVLQRGFVAPTLAVNIIGSKEMRAEELLAYELGYRFLGRQLSLDISAFYHDYDNLRSLEVGNIIPGAVNVMPLHLDNYLEGEAYGVELAATWQLNDKWRLLGSYSFVQMQLHLKPGSTDITEEGDEDDTPHHQFSIRSLWQINQDWQFDTTLRYVDKVLASPAAGKPAVDDYITLDVRLAWQVHEHVELSMVGQNLFGDHLEFRGSTVDTQATEVEPSVFMQADFRF